MSNKVQTPVYKTVMHVDIPPGGDKQMTASDLDTPVKRGFYLATIAHCMECHTPMVNDRHDLVNDLGQGGEEFKGPFGVSVSRNFTSHKEKGIKLAQMASFTAKIIFDAISQWHPASKQQKPSASKVTAASTENNMGALGKSHHDSQLDTSELGQAADANKGTQPGHGIDRG